MSNAERDDLDTDRWCAGLRCTGTRPLAPEERARVEQRVRSLTHRLRVYVACAPVAALVPVAAYLMPPRLAGPAWIGIALAIGVIAIACVVPVTVALRARDLMRARRHHRDDLAGDEALRFEGSLESDDPPDEEQKQLFDAGLLQPAPDEQQRLDVLPVSGMVLQAGTDPARFVTVVITEVAAEPPYAMRVEVPPRMAWIEGTPEARFLRRTLSPTERVEIALHIQRLRKPSVLVLLWTACLTGWAVAFAVSPRGVAEYAQDRVPFVLFQAVVLALVAWTYVRALALAWRLERDTRTGWALTMQRVEAVDGDDEMDGPASTVGADDEDVIPGQPHPRSCVEFLPHSRAVWNERGRPARWRNLRRAA